MTKLGVTPGVHGETSVEEEKKDELTHVKVDPKVFTVLQPITVPAPVVVTAQRKPVSLSICKWLALIAFVTSAALITFLLANMYYADTALDKVLIISSDDATSSTPATEAQKLESPVVLPVATIDGGSEKNKDKKVIDGSVEKEEEATQWNQWNPVMAAMQARWYQQQQEVQMWRWRRIQQALYEQAQAREYWMRQQAYAEQQQRAAAIARAQWEASREEQARAEAYRQWHVQQQWNQWNQQQQWQQQQQQQPQWPQQQQQQPQQQWFPQQQWQQQQQQWPQQQQWQQQQPQQAWGQEQQMQQPHPRVLLLRSFARVLPIHMTLNQIPMRPDAEQPQQQPEQELPQPAIHDRIYQQLQKKSQGMELNAPSRPIWTAITPTPETPTTHFDEEAAFQENLKKSLEQEAQQTSTAATPPSVDSSAEKKEGEVTDDGVIRDIFSALATAAEKDESTPAPESATEENVFKAFANEDDKAIDAAKKDPSENVFKSFESDEDKKTAEKSGFAEFSIDGAPKQEPKEEVKEEKAVDPKPTENVFKAFANDDDKAIDAAKPTETQPVVVFEDRFPRIEERTTTPEAPLPSTDATPKADESNDEHDPLAAFLKYFEQEARRMAEMRAASTEATESPVVPVEGEAAQQPTQPAVDVPEPHFKTTA